MEEVWTTKLEHLSMNPGGFLKGKANVEKSDSDLTK